MGKMVDAYYKRKAKQKKKPEVRELDMYQDAANHIADYIDALDPWDILQFGLIGLVENIRSGAWREES
jgi:hypothetical protein